MRWIRSFATTIVLVVTVQTATAADQARSREAFFRCKDRNGQTRYGDFKKVVADEVRQFLTDFQARLANIDDTAILAKLQDSEQKLTITANATLLRAQKAVGLRPKDA